MINYLVLDCSQVLSVQGVKSVVLLLCFFDPNVSFNYTMYDIVYHLYDRINVLLENGYAS